MDIQQAIDDACAIDRKIYLLFPAGRRITVYAQQIRALTLIEALRQTTWMPEVQSVAIVGGGISGITAAMALHVADLREGLKVSIFESRERLVPLQASCREKMLAPHIIDWPKAGSTTHHAELPLLEWTAAMAGEVAIDLMRQFDRIEINKRVLTRVTGITPDAQGVALTIEQNGTTSTENFEVVIVAAGFGLERLPAAIRTETPSYWRCNWEQQVELINAGATEILISGLGDGGLIDFVLCSCPSLSHERLCRDLMSSIDVTAMISAIESIEAGAWANPSTIGSLGDAYRELKLDRVARELILPNLARNKHFTLLTRGHDALSRAAAPLNRLAAATVMHAIRMSPDYGTTVEVVTNGDLIREDPDKIYVYQTPAGEVSRRFDLAILRHGDNQTAAWQFGCDEIDEKVAELRKRREDATARPQTPALSPSVEVAIADRALQAMPTRIRLTRDGQNVTWHSDCHIDRIGKLWPKAAIQIEIPFAPNVEQKLDLALARFMGHFDMGVSLKSPFHEEWGNIITIVEQRSGPGLIEPAVRAGTVAVQGKEFQNQPDVLAQHMQVAMDLGLLRLLDRKMTTFIENPLKRLPVDLHPSIRGKVLAAWPAWFNHLSDKGAEDRNWVLTLFASLLDSRGLIDPWAHVRLGPRCIDGEILPAIIYHLAMQELLADFGDASRLANGNVRRLIEHNAAAHICGASYAVDDEGEAVKIEVWEPRYPGEAWLPSALVLPNRYADFLPPETSTRRKSSSRMLDRSWARPPIVHASRTLLESLKMGEAEAIKEFRKMLDPKLPILD